MRDDPRTYHDVEIDGETVRACDWCSFVQVDEPDGLPDHATWCESDAMRDRAAAAMKEGQAGGRDDGE